MSGQAPDARAARDAFAPELFTDLYQLTMLQAYAAEGMAERAVFSLYVRTLPPERNFLVAAGLDDALSYLETLRFGPAALAHLRTLPQFSQGFVDALAGFRFSGHARAVREGTPVFAGEPLLEIEAPIGEAQLVETYLLNQITFQTLIASKGARVVLAARGKPVIDFGTRRTHGLDAALKAARALFVVGFTATSNVEAGRRYGIPVTGTMAHSYVQAHATERAAFAAFVRENPGTVLLVDTYDTEQGVRRVVELARASDDFRVSAVRLDSGDLDVLSRRTRAILDDAGMRDVGIVASGGLDEFAVAQLEHARAPIDAYAVGTRVGTSADAPTLDSVYKLTAYAGEGSIKLSPGKQTSPGSKQVFRRIANGVAVADVIARATESVDGEPLLRSVMRDGRRLPDARPTLAEIRAHAAAQLRRLPPVLRSFEPAPMPYAVSISAGLGADASAAEAAARRDRGG